MIFLNRIYIIISFVILCAFSAKAQDKPIGYWESHLPYNSAVGIATDGTNLFTICNTAFFTYDPLKSAQFQLYSKVEGMSDLGMQCIGYDIATSAVVLVYADGNIDVFKNNTFYNIPDLKIKSVAGNKAVYNVYTENGLAYLSTSLGILVISLTDYNVNETYQFIKNNQVIPVTSFTGSGTYYYATTSSGLYRSNKSNPELQNFQTWQIIDSTRMLISMASVDNTLFLSDTTNLYKITNDTLQTIYSSPLMIQHIDSGANSLLVSEYNPHKYQGDLKIINLNYQPVDSFSCGDPVQALQLLDGSIWFADVLNGLSKAVHGNLANFVPGGPNNVNAFDIYVNNKNVWIAHGGYSELYTPDGWGYGMSNYADGNWQIYKLYSYPPFADTIFDLVRIIKDETNGTVYAGSYQDGLFTLYQNGSYQILKQNSIFNASTSVSDAYEVAGLALDQSDNLWVTVAFAQHQLYVKTPDSVWYQFSVPGLSSLDASAGQIVIDANGQVWFAAMDGAGVAVVNTNGTVSNPNGYLSYHLSTGVGFGNLPSNNVFCLAKDLNNNIWVGTDNGIGIVSNCTAPFTQSSAPCDAEIPIVQYDQFAGYLFAGYNVRSIAVDGANRKWVGTDDGVWLLSPDASKIVYYFTADNSPLPSNTIEKIAIDNVTGDVYIGTDQGLVTYHGTATTGGTSNQNVLIFPDPVPSGYTGTIAIKGLVTDADVRITDITGELVYRTTALGGQAVWNGLDYKGHRPQTGVYLIFVSSSDGSQTYQGKILFMN